MTGEQIVQLLASFIWLLAGVGVFIVGMNFMSSALEKSAGNRMKNVLGRISGNRFSGVGIGAGVTAIIQSSSATSVMIIGLVNAGVMTLIQATPIIMGANIGTTITGILVALKNDYFEMLMYLLAFIGVMMSFVKSEKIKTIGSLFCGLGLIFVGLNIMSSEQAFKNDLVEDLFISIFKVVNFPLLLIFIGVIFTALIQSSSAATGVVITMVGTGVLPLELALFIVLGANIGTCVTALLASIGANANSKRVAFIHFIFNVIGTSIFTIIIWIFKDSVINLLINTFPNSDATSLQMRVSLFHVIFNVSTTCLLLPFAKQLVKLSQIIIKDKKADNTELTLKFVDERLLTMPSVALIQVKKEINYMMELVKENIQVCFNSIEKGTTEYSDVLANNEEIIDFTNSTLTKYLIKLSANVHQSDEAVIASYFHVLNDLERIGDHAENFHEIGIAMKNKELTFSTIAKTEIANMRNNVEKMFEIAENAFKDLNTSTLPTLTMLENTVDEQKRTLTANHFNRLADGVCSVELSPYFSSTIAGLERVADHLVNVGFSIVDPTGAEQITD